MRFTSTSISILALASSSLASADTRSIKLTGRSAGRTLAYKNADGSFNPEFVKVELEAVARKYAQHVETLNRHKISHKPARSPKHQKGQHIGHKKPKSSTPVLKRAGTGTVDLTDRIEGSQDVEYVGPVSIGTPLQVLPVDFDTGSSDLWLPVIAIPGSGGEFNSGASSSFVDSGNQFQITYGSGDVSGTVASDTVQLGGLNVATQAIGAVTQESSQFNGDPSAGILGMAFSAIAQTRQPTVVENLIAANALSQNLFAFHYTRGVASGSELSIGATDPSHFTGEIVYTPVTSQTYWEVQATAPTVDGQSVGQGFPAAIDTGTTLIYVPTAVADAIYAAIPGAAASGDGSSYNFPCDSTSVVALTFAGSSASFAINASDFSLGSNGGGQCTGAIMGADNKDQSGQNFAIVGDSFLKNWYTVFSYDQASGSPAVGFAQNV